MLKSKLVDSYNHGAHVRDASGLVRPEAGRRRQAELPGQLVQVERIKPVLQAVEWIVGAQAAQVPFEMLVEQAANGGGDFGPARGRSLK